MALTKVNAGAANPGHRLAMLRLVALCLWMCLPALTAEPVAAGGLLRPAVGNAATADKLEAARPSQEIARQLFGLSGPVSLQRQDDTVPGWLISQASGPVGHIASTWEVTRSLGYSGKPLDVLVAVDMSGHIRGARLMRHSEPVLTLGLDERDIARFVGGFAGVDLANPQGAGAQAQMPDIIARATVSSGVIRDSILRTARTLAIARGILPGGGIDRVNFAPRDWPALRAQGAIATRKITMTEASRALDGAKVALPEGEAPFIEIAVALLDPPTIGQNILGRLQYSRVMGALGPGETALFVASRGLYSHRGLAWRRSGVFDRLSVVQGENRIALVKSGYRRIDKLAIAGAPDFKERSVFHLPGEGFEPTRPFTLELTASRPAAAGGEVSFVTTLDYALPASYITRPPAAVAPLWQSRWRQKKLQAVSVMVMMAALTLILLVQEWIVRRKRLWLALRMGYLALTLVWLGWILNGQLSVVQVVAFVQALLSGFRWEAFLI